MKMILIATALSFAFIGASTSFVDTTGDAAADELACGGDSTPPKPDKPKADKPKKPKPKKPKNPTA
jgi:hypothetical protein